MKLLLIIGGLALAGVGIWAPLPLIGKIVCVAVGGVGAVLGLISQGAGKPADTNRIT